MKNESGFKKTEVISTHSISLTARSLHPAWSALIKYCTELQHGEIEILKIQDGLPLLAEVIRKKVKFVP